MASRPVALDLAQGCNSDHIVGHIQIDVFFQPNIERAGLSIRVATDGYQAAFGTLCRSRRARADAKRFACFLEDVPEFRSLRSVAKINFEATLLRPSRTLHGNGNPLDLGFPEPEIPDLPYPVAKNRSDDILALWSLDRHGRDIRFADLDIKTALGGYRPRPDPDIAVGNREPVEIVGQLEQDRIVDDRSLVIAERHVFALPDLAFGKIAWRQDLRQPARIRPLQLNLPFAAHIPL